MVEPFRNMPDRCMSGSKRDVLREGDEVVAYNTQDLLDDECGFPFALY